MAKQDTDVANQVVKLFSKLKRSSLNKLAKSYIAPCVTYPNPTSDGNDDRIFEIIRGESNEGVLTLAKRLDREFSGLHLLTIKCFRPYERNVKAKRAKYDSMVSKVDL